MNIKIITGMNNTGKTIMFNYFEKLGYLCHNNFPAKFLFDYIKKEEIKTTSSKNLLFVIDCRSETEFNTLLNAIKYLKNLNCDVSLIYLDSSNEVLINRYKEKKYLHHFQIIENLSLMEAIDKERALIEILKNNADYIFDTSNLSKEELLNKIKNVFDGNALNNNKLLITCMSFGFKHGTPKGIDILFDVRCFKNPYWIPELKELTGQQKEVQDYILSFQDSKDFLDKVYDMIEFLIPIYIKEGKKQFTIGFGCTGGHHRSVCFAEKTYDYLLQKDFNIIKKHINLKD